MTALPLPIHPVVLPADLAGCANGGLRANQLRSVGPRGLLHPTAAAAWLELVAEARAAGIALTYTYGGTYRSLSEQTALFRSRYTLAAIPNRPTKRWNGVRWWQLPNTAMAAVPGTSNHGWGLAIDTALGDTPQLATSITPRLGWLLEHAPALGFSWETESEPWHIRYIAGDRSSSSPTPAPETVPNRAPATIHVPPLTPEQEELQVMSDTPIIVRSESYAEVFLIGAGTPMWLTGAQLAEYTRQGRPGGAVPVVVSAEQADGTPHPSFMILAARAGCPTLTHL